MSNGIAEAPNVVGWGVDADPANNPTYPMRHVEDQRTRGFTWDRPPLQEPEVEILRSVEHDRLPAVVGTSTPPSGLSGMIRRAAFRRSESDWWHWLLLMGADRINVVEGIVEDLAHGTVPNIPAEMGVKAEWRHNKKGLATKLGVALAAAGAVYTLRRMRDRGGARTDEQEASMTATRTATLHRMVLPDHTCPFGVRANALLEQAGYQVDDHILRSREEVDAFKAQHGIATTPLIFIEGERIGGSNELERYLATA
jgi:glutaredoxin